MRCFSFIITKNHPKIHFLFFLAGNAKGCYTGFIDRKRSCIFRKFTLRNQENYRKFTLRNQENYRKCMLTEKDIIKGETKDDFTGIGKRSAKIA
jgi:hypothetical protein